MDTVGKVCKDCGEWKPFTEYHVKKGSADGHRSRCKSCRYTLEHKVNAIRAAKWQSEHRDRVNASIKMRRSKNPDGRKEESKKRYSKNPNYFYEAGRKRRALKLSAGGHFTEKEWKALCDKFNNRCLCCGRIVKLERDHIVPLTRGGNDDISNIQPLCRLCNGRKFKSIIDYRNPFVAMAT